MIFPCPWITENYFSCPWITGNYFSCPWITEIIFSCPWITGNYFFLSLDYRKLFFPALGLSENVFFFIVLALQ
jgi:hypothetical protein